MSTPSRLLNGAVDTPASGETQRRDDVAAREKMKILVVDDNPDNLISIEAALHTLNEQVVTARSGTEALRYLLVIDFAAILMITADPSLFSASMVRLLPSLNWIVPPVIWSLPFGRS